MTSDVTYVRLAKESVGRFFGRLRPGKSTEAVFQLADLLAHGSPPARVLAWIRANELSTGGIRVHSKYPNAYPEVTGYIVPTLLQHGEKDLAIRLLRWLASTQRANGGYADCDGREEFVFDTGQVLRGLLAGSELLPQARDAATRAADYLCAQMVDGGNVGFPEGYSGEVPESVHLYVLPVLRMAADVLEKEEYRHSADRCLEYYLSHRDSLQIGNLTHFLAYELEALVDLGRKELAVPVLDRVRERQKADGSVSALPGVPWVCSPGLAQLAVCWYKTGEWKAADRALAWLESHQRPSGGFLGSYGAGAAYFPREELSWTAKFFLDAHHLRVRSFAERQATSPSDGPPGEDQLLQAVLELVGDGDRVANVGCGSATLLTRIREARPGARCTAIGLSPLLLSSLPDGITRVEGSVESIPCEANAFDVVFSVEGLQYSANPEAALSELIRVVRPGGWVLLAGSRRSRLRGRTRATWTLDLRRLAVDGLLKQDCDCVSFEQAQRDGTAPEWSIWRGRKRSALTGSDWHAALISPSSRDTVIQNIRANRLSEWAQAVVLATRQGERVLEVGSGTGEISLTLARVGRKVTVLDCSEQSLEFTQRCAQDLGVQVETVQADANCALPFADGTFDCVWSSGLLEHFTSDERRAMLAEWKRVSRAKVVALVPNAVCVAYRAGKAYLEQQGKWPYGLEAPIRSLREEFEAVGLHVQSETSVGARHALGFLPPKHALRKALSAWLEGLSDGDLTDCNQGYLLVTIGLTDNASM